MSAFAKTILSGTAAFTWAASAEVAAIQPASVKGAPVVESTGTAEKLLVRLPEPMSSR